MAGPRAADTGFVSWALMNALALVAIAAWFLRSLVLAIRRQRALRAWGEARGYAFAARGRRPDELGFDLACLRLGKRRKARNVLEGRRNGRRVVVCDFSWRIGDGEDAVRHERLVSIVEGRAAREKAAARLADLGDILSAGLDPTEASVTIRPSVSVRVVRAGHAAPVAAARHAFASAPEPGAPRVECGSRAVAVVAPRRTPPEAIDGLLALAESMLEPAPVAAGKPG